MRTIDIFGETHNNEKNVEGKLNGGAYRKP